MLFSLLTMKKFLNLIIGFVIIFGGMHYVPTHAMNSDMGDMQHCSSCSKEDQLANRCNSSVEKNNSAVQIPYDDCDCDFGTEENNHHKGIVQLKNQQLKEKTSSIDITKYHTEIFNDHKILSPFNAINAPPNFYIRNITTIQQLR